jgi:hypothetical protein
MDRPAGAAPDMLALRLPRFLELLLLFDPSPRLRSEGFRCVAASASSRRDLSVSEPVMLDLLPLLRKLRVLLSLLQTKDSESPVMLCRRLFFLLPLVFSEETEPSSLSLLRDFRSV